MYELTIRDLSWRRGGSEFRKCSHRTSQVRRNLITGQREPRNTNWTSWDTIQGTEGCRINGTWMDHLTEALESMGPSMPVNPG